MLLIAPHTVAAGPVTLLHEFDLFDGGAPVGGMAFDGERLYGTASVGGGPTGNGRGVLFAMRPNGSEYEILHEFAFEDGIVPEGALLLHGQALYGTTPGGGDLATGSGTVFAIATDGTGFRVLHSFVGSDGEGTSAGLTLVGDRLYGVANAGGAFGQSDFGYGTIFSIALDGSSFNVVHDFTGAPQGGARPSHSRLVSVGNELYGTTGRGGLHDSGIVYSIKPDGSGFQVLHEFDGQTGLVPFAGLVAVGTTLYGTTHSTTNGEFSFGTIFSLELDGSDFRLLHTFEGTDGYWPRAPLVVLGERLFGTTINHLDGAGGLFSIGLDGSGFEVVHLFSGAPNDGQGPRGLLPVDKTLYGVTSFGGAHDWGTVFSVTVPEPPGVATGGVAMFSLIVLALVRAFRKPLHWRENHVAIQLDGSERNRSQSTAR